MYIDTHAYTHTHTHTLALVLTTDRTGYMAPIQGVSQQLAARLVRGRDWASVRADACWE